MRATAWIIAFLLLGLTVDLLAQARGRVPPNRRDPVLLSEAEGERMLADFRAATLPGVYAMRFSLTRRTDSGLDAETSGVLWGHMPPEGAAWRIVVNDGFDASHWLMRGGDTAGIWRWESELPDEAASVGWADLTDPLAAEAELIPGWNVRAFDLQLPFIRWADTEYEGSLRVRGRPAHAFLFFPPEEDPRFAAITAIRVTLDEDFLALLEADVINQDGAVARTLKMASFKEIDDQWLVTRIDILDRLAGERIRWRLEAVDLAARLPETGFAPARAVPERPAATWREL